MTRQGREAEKSMSGERSGSQSREEIPFLCSWRVFLLKSQQKSSTTPGKPQSSSHRGILGIRGMAQARPPALPSTLRPFLHPRPEEQTGASAQSILTNTAQVLTPVRKLWDLSAPAPALRPLLPTPLPLPTHLCTQDSWLLKTEHKAVRAAIKISASFYLAANCQLPFKGYLRGGLKRKRRA